MLMQYQCGCGHKETIWNSRDGVTPFVLGCPSCGKLNLSHVNWHEDVYAPNHELHRHQRYFRDGTVEEAIEIMKRRIERHKSSYPLKREAKDRLLAEVRNGTLEEFRKGWPTVDVHMKES